MAIWVDRPGTDDYLAIGDHEAGLFEILVELCPAGAFLDVGAHVGRYTVRMAQLGRPVVAVEGNSDTCRTLRQNVERFGVEVEVVCGVAWDDALPLRMIEPYRESGSTRFVAHPEGDRRGFRLDSLWRKDRPIQCMKLDVEGSEAEVLRGAHDLLVKDRPQVVIELHEQIKTGITKMVKHLLEAAGYTHRVAFSYGQADYLQGIP